MPDDEAKSEPIEADCATRAYFTVVLNSAALFNVTGNCSTVADPESPSTTDASPTCTLRAELESSSRIETVATERPKVTPGVGPASVTDNASVPSTTESEVRTMLITADVFPAATFTVPVLAV